MSLLAMLQKSRPGGFANAKAANLAKVQVDTPPTLATLATIALANLQKPAANSPTLATLATIALANLLNLKTIDSPQTTPGLPTNPAGGKLPAADHHLLPVMVHPKLDSPQHHAARQHPGWRCNLRCIRTRLSSN